MVSATKHKYILTGKNNTLRFNVKTMIHQKENQDSVVTSIESLRLEIQSLKNEFRKMEGTILKDRLKSVENALSQNRLLMYADQLGEELKEDFLRLMKDKCENQEKCAKKFSEFLSENLDLLKQSKIKEAFEDLDSKILQTKQMGKEVKRKGCEMCFRNVHKKLKREKRAFQTVTLVEKNWIETEPVNLDIAFLVKSFLEPLANQKRLAILFSLYEGKKSFSQLSQLTTLKAGHLIFHLNKLLGARIVAQEGNKGDYIIMQSGIDAIRRLLPKQLSK